MKIAILVRKSVFDSTTPIWLLYVGMPTLINILCSDVIANVKYLKFLVNFPH